MHKCQGMAQLLALPSPSATASYQLVETTLAAQLQKDETSLFDGVDSSIAGLARLPAPRAPKGLNEGLTVIANAVKAAQKSFDGVNDDATLKPLLDGLFAVRVLRRELRTMAIDDRAKYEIDFRLRQKEGEFQNAAILAAGVKVEALADDGVVVPGQAVKVNVIVANRGGGEVAIKGVKFEGFDGDASCSMTAFSGGGFFFPGAPRRPAAPEAPQPSVRRDQVAHCEPTMKVPADARMTEPYWHRKGEAGRYTFDPDAPFGLPMRPTPFYVQVIADVAGRRGSGQRPAGGAALSGQHLQRRETD